jgi:hypothetical protein
VKAAAAKPTRTCRAAENPALRPLKSDVNKPIAANASTLKLMH